MLQLERCDGENDVCNLSEWNTASMGYERVGVLDPWKNKFFETISTEQKNQFEKWNKQKNRKIITQIHLENRVIKHTLSEFKKNNMLSF